MKHILIFSYWFPPANVIGASRPAEVARYFAAQGWKVTVVCGASKASSLDYLPDLTGISVYPVEDTTITRLGSFAPNRGTVSRYFGAALRLIAIPDIYRSVISRMVAKARKVCEGQNRPDVIFSTALPFSSHIGARVLAREFGSIFVADNRDVWALSPYRRILPAYRPFEQAYERRILKSAHLVTAISQGMIDYFSASYPEINERMLVVRNGVDIRKPIVSKPKGRTSLGHAKGLELVYTGILYGTRRNISALLEATGSIDHPVRFNFFGAESWRLAELSKLYPLAGIADCGRVTREKALEVQRSADALVISVGTDKMESFFLPGKFFEYVGSGRPIIAVADPESELGKLISKYGLGIASLNSKEISHFLSELANKRVPTRKDVPEELTRKFQLSILEQKIVSLLATK